MFVKNRGVISIMRDLGFEILIWFVKKRATIRRNSGTILDKADSNIGYELKIVTQS